MTKPARLRHIALTVPDPAKAVHTYPFELSRWRNQNRPSWVKGGDHPITDAIISRLTTLQNLAVRPTNSVLKYARTSDDPVQAARELQVNSVLAGTYQRVGSVMRVSVQLIDSGATRWASRYDLQGRDMLRFEDDVAEKVVSGLSVQLSGSEQESLKSRSTNSVEAYNALLQARADWNEYFTTSQLAALRRAQDVAQHHVAGWQPFGVGGAYIQLTEHFEALGLHNIGDRVTIEHRHR